MSGSSQGEIWLIDLSDSRGHEQKGQRPAILWRDLDHIKMAIIIPCTTNQKANRFPHTCLLIPTLENGLSEDSVAMVFQIKSVDKKRLIKKLGKLDANDVQNIAHILRDMLRL